MMNASHDQALEHLLGSILALTEGLRMLDKYPSHCVRICCSSILLTFDVIVLFTSYEPQLCSQRCVTSKSGTIRSQ